MRIPRNILVLTFLGSMILFPNVSASLEATIIERAAIKIIADREMRRKEIAFVEYYGSISDVQIAAPDLPEGLDLSLRRGGLLLLSGTPREAFSGRVEIKLIDKKSSTKMSIHLEIEGNRKTTPPKILRVDWDLRPMRFEQAEKVNVVVGRISNFVQVEAVQADIHGGPPGLSVLAREDGYLSLRGIPVNQGRFDFEISVRDAASQRVLDTRSGSMEVLKKNLPPEIQLDNEETMVFQVGEKIDRIIGQTLDDELTNDLKLTVSGMPSGLELRLSNRRYLRIIGTPNRHGRFKVVLVVEDSGGATTRASISVNVRRENQEPKIELFAERFELEQTANVSKKIGQVFDDGMLDQLSIEHSLPGNLDLRISSEGLIWMYGRTSGAGEYRSDIKVRDPGGEISTVSLMVSVRSAQINDDLELIEYFNQKKEELNCFALLYFATSPEPIFAIDVTRIADVTILDREIVQRFGPESQVRYQRQPINIRLCQALQGLTLHPEQNRAFRVAPDELELEDLGSGSELIYEHFRTRTDDEFLFVISDDGQYHYLMPHRNSKNRTLSVTFVRNLQSFYLVRGKSAVITSFFKKAPRGAAENLIKIFSDLARTRPIPLEFVRGR